MLYDTSQHIQQLLGAFCLKCKNAIFKGGIEKNHYLCEGGIEKSDTCDHHLSSLGKPRDANR